MEEDNLINELSEFIHWYYEGERIELLIQNIGMYIASEGKFIEGILLVTKFRIEFLWFTDNEQVDATEDNDIKLTNSLKMLDGVKSSSMDFFSSKQIHVVMTPISNICKIEEKRIVIKNRYFSEIIMKGKATQSFHWREKPGLTRIYNTQTNESISLLGKTVDDLSMSQSYSGSSLLFTKLHSLIDRQNQPLGLRSLYAFSLREHNDRSFQLSLLNSVRSEPSTKMDTPLKLHFPCLDILYGFPSNRIKRFPLFSPADIEKGFSIYDPIKEFTRQGAIHSESSNWRISDINLSFSLSESYPERLCVPLTVSDQTLKECAKFRSRARIPVLTWLHPNGTPITRSSQPLTGITFAHSEEDERVIAGIRHTSTSDCLVIVDARPKTNAFGNALMGKGYENISRYSKTSIEFMGIENIHTMSSSLKEVKLLFQKRDQDQWISAFEGTGWTRHTVSLLKGVNRIIELVEDYKTPVLVRCSDGWDRTSQLTSLAAICMDPFYRTIEGFEILIEKDWVHFGHKFKDRSGLVKVDAELSPIFLQFIDCVYHLYTQFPKSFEFNHYFLHCIAEHIYSGLFGTFLANSEKEMRKLNIQNKTISLWSYLNHETLQQNFKNPLYTNEIDRIVLRPKWDSSTIIRNFWWNYFSQTESYGDTYHEFITDKEAKIREQEKEIFELKQAIELERQNKRNSERNSILYDQCDIDDEITDETDIENEPNCNRISIPYFLNYELDIIKDFLNVILL